MIDWSKSTFTKRDHETASKIANAVNALGDSVDIDKLSILMDLEACNIVCPLDLDKLLAFDSFNLAHDVCGIANHLNRTTGELEDCFLPRCAATVPA